MSSKTRRPKNATSQRPGIAESPAAKSGARGARSPLRLTLMAILGVALTGLILSNSLVAYLGDQLPEFAVSLGVAPPRALVKLADEAMRQTPKVDQTDPAKSPADAQSTVQTANAGLSDADIKDYAVQALAADPLNAGAFRILGLSATHAGDKAAAAGFMTAAAARNVHESEAFTWLLQDSVERGDQVASARLANTLLMTHGSTTRFVVGVLAKLAEDETGRKEVVRLLADNPRWRSSALSLMPAQSADARTTFLVLEALKQTPNPPTSKDISSYLSFLTAHKLHDFSYYVWLQFLPADQLSSLGLIYNGNFEAPLTGGPFDWTLTDGSGSSVKIEPTQDQNGHALYVEFGLGRVDFGGVRQTIMLGPGTYKVEGRYTGEMQAKRGLEWRVSCLETASKPLAASEMFTKSAPTWTPFEFTFEVPAVGCVGQSLSLVLNARLASEHILSGNLWFDDLQISALPVEATASAAPLAPVPVQPR